MKLCEAMMGQDLLGFHSNSVFRRGRHDGRRTSPLSDRGRTCPPDGPLPAPGERQCVSVEESIRTAARRRNFDPTNFVLCDVYARQMDDEKTGMPILYYKANTSNTLHLHDPQNVEHRPSNATDAAGNIYNYRDNQELVDLGKPWVRPDRDGTASMNHRLAD